MRGLVICWMLIGGSGIFLVFPWYVTGDGFFLYKLATRIFFRRLWFSITSVAFISNKYWLLPIAIPYFSPLSTLKLIKINISIQRFLLYSGLIGIFYFFLQGFSVLVLEDGIMKYFQ